MNAMTSAVAAELAAEFPSKVVPLKPVPPARPNADRLADLHRREALSCQQRIADSKRVLKAELSTIATTRKLRKAEFDAEMLALSEAETFARERTAQAIAEDERLARYNTAALGALAD